MSITLGKFHYPRPVVVLAPMAGVSDLPFRRLCQQNGADFTVAEMISAKPELMNTPLAAQRLAFDDDARSPKIVQIVGGDAYLMAEAAQFLQAKGADVIDINAGCPAKVVGKQQAGSALLGDLPRLEKILRQVVQAVHIPVTLKTRLGFAAGESNLLTVGEMAAANGIQLISVHGRTRAQKFTGKVDFAPIAALKNRSPIPVIANGDIVDASQAAELITRYGFDGIMIGRAAQGNPWLFAACQALINQRFFPPPARRAQITTHLHGLYQHYGDYGVILARKHLHAYCRQRDDYDVWRGRINAANDRASQLALLESEK